jgi:hypothetical protein
MSKIAFILLCHKDPSAIIKQAQGLTAAGDYISIHFDARARPEEYRQLRDALDENPNITFAQKRIKCGWGEWSLVQASLNAIESAMQAFPRATHFYMLSGDCMPIKSAHYIHRFLDQDDCDYIESFDYFESNWIKTGWKEERLIYRHWVNERTQKWLFYTMFKVQRQLGLKRSIPQDLQVQIGSQWWCLRRQTIERILEFSSARKDVMRFFKTTWIPDETFFQTLVRHLVPEREIRARTLTFLLFTDYGMPVVFYNDHYDMLICQDYLFARKISPEATHLKARLSALFSAGSFQFKVSNEGRNLFQFLTGRGRIGRRFGTRFWETESSLGRDRELMILVCKKWHVAKRLAERIRRVTDLTAIDYLFNEENTPMPDLGGLQSGLGKRTRHRRALLRMLFDYYDTNRLVLCIDTGNLDLFQDFCGDRALTRLLEIECTFANEYLIGHAMRVGLAGPQTPPETLNRLLPTIRNDMAHESDRLRDQEFANHYRLRQDSTIEERIEPIAKFLSLPGDKAREIAETDYLFAD